MTDGNETPPPEKRPMPEGLRRFIVTFSLLLALWLGVRYAMPLLWPTTQVATPAPQQTQAPANDLPQHLAALEARVAMLENAPAARAADETRILQLEEKLAVMQTQMQTSTAQVALITAFTQTREALLAGAPYRAPLDRLARLAESHEAAASWLNRLEDDADSGVATLAALQLQFEAATETTMVNADGAGALSGLIRIRRVGEEQKGTDDESVIARAEAKLQRGDVRGSLKEVAQLSPPAIERFAPWIQKAQAHQDARAAMDALQVELLSPAAGEAQQ